MEFTGGCGGDATVRHFLGRLVAAAWPKRAFAAATAAAEATPVVAAAAEAAAVAAEAAEAAPVEAAAAEGVATGAAAPMAPAATEEAGAAAAPAASSVGEALLDLCWRAWEAMLNPAAITDAGPHPGLIRLVSRVLLEPLLVAAPRHVRARWLGGHAAALVASLEPTLDLSLLRGSGVGADSEGGPHIGASAIR